MEKIRKDMTVKEALEAYPKVFPAFQQVGVCCVQCESAEWTVEELCANNHVDAESFLTAVNNLL